MVYEDDKWVSVEDSNNAFKTNISTNKVYCANTTSGELLIDGIKFKDYNESIDPEKNKDIQEILLNHLNNNPSKEYTNGGNYLEPGYGKDTVVIMDGGIDKKINEISIGDKLNNGNIVEAKIEISGKYCNFYNHNGITLTENTVVNDNGIWKTAAKSSAQNVNNNDIAYNIIVIGKNSGKIPLSNGIEYNDYEDWSHDENIYNKIKNYVS